jgi:hypothetical protein
LFGVPDADGRVSRKETAMEPVEIEAKALLRRAALA